MNDNVASSTSLFLIETLQEKKRERKIYLLLSLVISRRISQVVVCRFSHRINLSFFFFFVILQGTLSTLVLIIAKTTTTTKHNDIVTDIWYSSILSLSLSLINEKLYYDTQTHKLMWLRLFISCLILISTISTILLYFLAFAFAFFIFYW